MFVKKTLFIATVQLNPFVGDIHLDIDVAPYTLTLLGQSGKGVK